MGTFPPVPPKVPPPERAFDPLDARQGAATIPAASEADLRRAIDTVSKGDRPATIMITAPITLKAPIIIPGHVFTAAAPRGGCDGLKIISAGRVPITASGVVACVFDVRARDVRIEGLYVAPPRSWTVGSSVAIVANVFTDFVRMTSAANATGDSMTVVDCVAHIQREGVHDVNSCAGRLVAERNVFFQLKAPSASEAVIITTRDKFRIVDNGIGTFPSGGPFEGIRVSTEHGVIADNEGDIRTAVPSTIVLGNPARGVILAGNTGFGTKTLGEGALDLDESYSRQTVADADLSAAALDFIGATTIVEYTSLTATRTVNIPSPAAISRTKQRLIVKDGSGSCSATVKIILDPDLGVTIDGAATYEITSAYGSVEIVWNGTNWIIAGKVSATSSAADTTLKLRQPALFLAAGAAATKILTTNTTFAVYMGRAGAAYTSVSIRWRLAAQAATVTWSELGVATGAPVAGGGNPSLTRRGTTTVDFTVGTGVYSSTVALSGIAAGDDLWILFGNQATTVAQLRAGLADDLASGSSASAAATRPSTMASPTTFTAEASTVALPWFSAVFS